MKNLLDKVNIFRLLKVNSNPSSKELEIELYLDINSPLGKLNS